MSSKHLTKIIIYGIYRLLHTHTHTHTPGVLVTKSDFPRHVGHIHSCQPPEFVIPNGGGFGRGAEENGAHAQGREANCSLQRMCCSTDQRTCECGLQQADVLCHLRNTRKEKKGKKSRIFIIRKQNSSFGNSYSNLDFLIIMNKSGGLAAMGHLVQSECDQVTVCH